jgi:hypothetical protein
MKPEKEEEEEEEEEEKKKKKKKMGWEYGQHGGDMECLHNYDDDNLGKPRSIKEDNTSWILEDILW